MYRHVAALFTIWSMVSSRKSFRACTSIGWKPPSAAPTAAPVSAASDSGVSNTRWLPNSRHAPRVVPKMPFGSSTPTPITKMVASFAIAWRVPSSIASR